MNGLLGFLLGAAGASVLWVLQRRAEKSTRQDFRMMERSATTADYAIIREQMENKYKAEIAALKLDNNALKERLEQERAFRDQWVKAMEKGRKAAKHEQV